MLISDVIFRDFSLANFFSFVNIFVINLSIVLSTVYIVHFCTLWIECHFFFQRTYRRWENRIKYRWSSSDTFHLQSLSKIWSLAIYDVYAGSCWHHASYDESSDSNSSWSCIGIGAPLVACFLNIFSRSYCRLHGNVFNQPTNIFGWRIWRSLCIDYSTHSHNYFGKYFMNWKRLFELSKHKHEYATLNAEPRTCYIYIKRWDFWNIKYIK